VHPTKANNKSSAATPRVFLVHTLIPKFEEDMEFQRRLSVKEFLEIFKSRKSDIVYLFFDLRNNFFLTLNIFVDFFMGEQITRVKSCFGIKDKINFNKIPKILKCTIRTMIPTVWISQSFPLNLILNFRDLISSCLRS
jgi:hypothetical protein